MLALDVAHAESFEIHSLTVLLDQNDGAGYLAVRNLVADIVADALQFRARETASGSNCRFCTAGARSSGRDCDNQKRERRCEAAAAREAVSAPLLHGSASSSPAGCDGRSERAWLKSVAGNSVGTRVAKIGHRLRVQPGALVREAAEDYAADGRRRGQTIDDRRNGVPCRAIGGETIDAGGNVGESQQSEAMAMGT